MKFRSYGFNCMVNPASRRLLNELKVVPNYVFGIINNNYHMGIEFTITT